MTFEEFQRLAHLVADALLEGEDLDFLPDGVVVDHCEDEMYFTMWNDEHNIQETYC